MRVISQQAENSSGLADAMRRLQEVLRLSRSAVWEIDRDGVFTYVSPSFEELLGYRPEELVGLRKIGDFYPPDLPPELHGELSADWIAEGREFKDAAVPLMSKSGETIWVSSSGAPLRDERGNVTGYRGADVDITAIKRSEQQARAREEQLLRQLAAAPVPIAYTGTSSGNALHVNEAFVRTFGYEPEEIPTPEAWFAKAYPDETYRNRVMQESGDLKAALARGESPKPREYKISCKDGRVLDVEISAAFVGDCFLGTFVDVTARRKEATDLFAILDNLPFPVSTSVAGDGITWDDPRALVTFVNRPFTESFGYTREDIPTVGRWARCAFPDETKRNEALGALDRHVHAAVRGDGEVGPAEVAVMTKDGRCREVLIRGVFTDGLLVTSLEDVTERNKAQHLLREHQEQLARVGRVSALGQLAASLAHELDQPLGAILNNAETAEILLAAERPDVPELRSIVRDIVEDDRRAGAVLDRIRAMVQKQPFAPAAVDVGALFVRTSELVRSVIEAKQIRFEMSVEPGLRPVEGDAVLLQQAVLNLVLNAVDAIGARTDGIVQVRAGESAGDSLAVSVGDNGGGVRGGEEESLLVPFHTTKKEGLGMGLPIVATIVEQHGGELRFDNLPGRGLTVTMLLPAWKGGETA